MVIYSLSYLTKHQCSHTGIIVQCFQDERVKLTEGFRGEMELHVRVNTIWREYILVNDKTKYTLVMFVGDEEFLSFVG